MKLSSEEEDASEKTGKLRNLPKRSADGHFALSESKEISFPWNRASRVAANGDVGVAVIVNKSDTVRFKLSKFMAACGIFCFSFYCLISLFALLSLPFRKYVARLSSLSTGRARAMFRVMMMCLGRKHSKVLT